MNYFDQYKYKSWTRNKDCHLLLVTMKSSNTIDDHTWIRWLFRTRIMTGDNESDIKLGRWKKWLALSKWWENKYEIKCHWYVGVIPGCWYGPIECQDDSIYVSKHHSGTTGIKWVRWRYGSKLATFRTWNGPHHHQKEFHDLVMGIIASLDSWEHWANRFGPVVQLM